MTEQETLRWDMSQTPRSDTLTMLSVWPALVDRAIQIGAACSLDGNGVVFDILPAAEFHAMFGAAPQPRLPMGPAAGTGAVLANWTSDIALYKEQQKCRAEMRKLILDIFPNYLLVPMQDANRSIRSRSTEYIASNVRAQLATLTKADFEFLMRELSAPYQPGTSASTFVTNWQASARDLDRAGQGLPQNMATDLLQKCFGPDFHQCWMTFVQTFPLVAQRTVERLCAAIIVFAKDALPLIAAHSVIGISAVTNQTEMMAKMQAKIDQLEQQALAVSIDSRKRGQASANDRPAKQSRDTALSARPFCWSHGPRGHLGADCTDKLPGHKPEATWANQKGSNWKEIFARRGWKTA